MVKGASFGSQRKSIDLSIFQDNVLHDLVSDAQNLSRPFPNRIEIEIVLVHSL